MGACRRKRLETRLFQGDPSPSGLHKTHAVHGRHIVVKLVLQTDNFIAVTYFYHILYDKHHFHLCLYHYLEHRAADVIILLKHYLAA